MGRARPGADLRVEPFCMKIGCQWLLFFTVALDTGLRRGEMVGLRWGDVNLLDRSSMCAEASATTTTRKPLTRTTTT